MKKRILSLALTAAMTLGCFGGMPAAFAADGEPTFNEAEHLIKVSDENYQIVSLNGEVTLNLFTDDVDQWSYSVEKGSLIETTESLELGDVNFEGVIDVTDIMLMKSMIMDEGGNEREMLVANANRTDGVDVSDILVVKNAIMTETSIGTVDLVTITGSEPEVWVEESTLGLEMDGVTYFKRASVENITVTETDRTYDHYGNQSVLHDNGIAVEVEFKQGGETYYLDARVYDNGVGFRYRMPGEGTRTVSKELTTFDLRDDLDEVWYGTGNRDYEPTIEKHAATEVSTDHINAPLTAVLSDGKGYIAVQEAGVGEIYGGTNLNAMGNGEYKISNTWDNGISDKARTITGEFATGWRLISIAQTLNDLVNNYNVYHVNEEPDAEIYADTSWIEPGRSAWSWLTDYGASLGSPDGMYEFTLNAARLGFEYNVIDEGYANWKNSNAALADLGKYGDELGVKQLLWAYVNPNHIGYQMTTAEQAEAYLDFLVESNIHGGKVDFWWSEEDPRTQTLQHEILKMAAERELIINFHGCPKPGGNDATYPNELSREGIRGLENIGASANTNYTAQANRMATQLFTRYLSGHADWTPACDTAMQMASMISIDSPLNVIATDPARILENPALEMIKSIPTVWDQTIVLSNSKIGDNSVYAKESDGNWYLGGAYANAAADVTVDLSEFLGDGEYMMELWVDTTEGTDTVPVKTEQVVTAEDALEIGALAAGQGFAARFSKIAFNHFGGEILEPITITTADEDAVVKYTIDGSDPLTSETAKTYEGPITLTASCDLRAAIVEGDDAGAAIKGNFNLITTAYLEKVVSYGEGETTVSFKYNGNGTVKYTTDGSDPLTSETAVTYEKPITLTERCIVNAVCVLENGNTASVSLDVYINPVEAILPDLYVDSDYVSAKTDWGQIYINESMSGGGVKISLGGTTADNGTKYDHGFSFNANGSIVYKVPDGATQFVGVVGIDDRTWDSNGGSAASSTCTISFDGVEAFNTPVFGRGDAFNIVVDVPTGAKQITIAFGDGGNGITCDNVAMGNAGWVLDSSVEKSLTHTQNAVKGCTTVELVKNFAANVYYTTDGSEPTSESAVYTAPLVFTKDVSLKVLAVPADGSEALTLEVAVEVDEIEGAPDVYLSAADLVSSSTGWYADPASINQNTKGETISIAGVEYPYGISTNSVGHFTFNIPEGATKFIGIAGVDDCTYDNAADGAKASITVSISFDGGAAVYTSDVIGQGGFVGVEIDVPEGAKQITITFGDSGNGITCDNASMGNAGWIIAK